MMHGSTAAACFFFSPTPISFLLASQTDFEKLQSTYQAHQHINVGICNRWRGGWRYHFYLRSRSSAPSKKNCIKLQLQRQRQTLQQLGFASKKRLVFICLLLLLLLVAEHSFDHY